MNIITVAPITRQKVPPSLTYFTAKDVPVGAVVMVPIRTKITPAIVITSRAASDLKTEIRNAPYEIKKLDKVRAGAFFTPAFIESCRELADFYAAYPGALMSAIVPELILENSHKIAPPLPLQPSFLAAKEPGTDAQDTYAVQGDDSDRMSSWRSLIRQQFARKSSVAIYAPTLEDVRQIYSALEKGIEGYIFLLHGGLPKKKMLETWAAISETKLPVVIISTPIFSVLPRADIESVILERENGRGWQSMRAPYIDHRRVLEIVNRRERRSVYLSDTLLRAETLERLEEHEIAHGTPFKWRSISTAADAFINMRQDADTKKESFHIFSDELKALIRLNREESTHLFIMTSRRGLATLTVCDDCEAIVSCPKCGTPVVLHVSKQSGRAFYMCHACGERKSADDVCANCGGHRLSPLGIGTERVRQHIKKHLPDIDVFQVDADATTTEKQITETIAAWREKPGAILVGTEIALNHLGGSVDHVAVASLDSLFALPDFRVEERLMYLLLRLRAAATKTILVQTRRPDEKVFEYGLKGNLSDFYRRVIADRKKFEYPPFTLLIKITIEGKSKEDIAREMGELQAHFAPHEINVFPAFTSTDRGTSLIHGLVKVPKKAWPDMELVEKLRIMPVRVSVKVNPESLL